MGQKREWALNDVDGAAALSTRCTQTADGVEDSVAYTNSKIEKIEGLDATLGMNTQFVKYMTAVNNYVKTFPSVLTTIGGDIASQVKSAQGMSDAVDTQALFSRN